MVKTKDPFQLAAAPIVGIGIVLRLAVVLVVVKTHSTTWFFDQATELGRLAEQLQTGHGLSSPFGGSTGASAFLSPGYPIIVTCVFAVFGAFTFASEVVIMLLQAIIGAATVLVAMLFTRRAFGVSSANTAGWICALCPPALYLPTLFWETSLSILLATSLVALANSCGEDSSVTSCLGLGGVGAAALAVNPALLPIVLCAFGWCILQRRTTSLLTPGMGLLICLALSAPWAVRNFDELHSFIPLRSNLGYELWQGNRVGSDGFFLASLHPNVNHEEYQRYQTLGEVAYMKEKLGIAENRIATNRVWFAGLTARRAFYFWFGIARQQSSLVVVYFCLTTVSGLVGLVKLSRHKSALAGYLLATLMLFPLPYYITHPDYRFRLVIDPILVALTGFAWSLRRTGIMVESSNGA